MTITFGYFFNMFFVMDLFEGIGLVLAYLMFIFSSRNQPRENKSSQLLRNAGIIGIAITILVNIFPTLICSSCSPSEIFVAKIYASTISLISLIPMLVCFGVTLILLGKRNKEIYGQILIASGILWVLTFLGYAIVFIALIFEMGIFLLIGVLSYLSIPAVILMIVHGVKFKDKFFILAGIFYILSWLAIFVVPWFPFPLI